MAELGIAQKAETAQKTPISIGRLKADAVLEVVKNAPKDISDEAFAQLLKSVEEKPVTAPMATNTSVLRVEKTNTAIVAATSPAVKIEPTPEKPKTAKELKKMRDEEWNREKKVRADLADNLHRKQLRRGY